MKKSRDKKNFSDGQGFPLPPAHTLSLGSRLLTVPASCLVTPFSAHALSCPTSLHCTLMLLHPCPPHFLLFCPGLLSDYTLIKGRSLSHICSQEIVKMWHSWVLTIKAGYHARVVEGSCRRYWVTGTGAFKGLGKEVLPTGTEALQYFNNKE